MRLDNDMNISIKKSYSKKQLVDGKVVEDETGQYHNLHTLYVSKEYPDRKDEVAVLEEVVEDTRALLQMLEKELAKVHRDRELFKGTDFEF